MITICEQEDHAYFPPDQTTGQGTYGAFVRWPYNPHRGFFFFFFFLTGKERLVSMVENLALGAGEKES